MEAIKQSGMFFMERAHKKRYWSKGEGQYYNFYLTQRRKGAEQQRLPLLFLVFDKYFTGELLSLCIFCAFAPLRLCVKQP
ncbi:MAG: hypothetical protein ABIQ31_00265 [Ferruginibacter sp.]